MAPRWLVTVGLLAALAPPSATIGCGRGNRSNGPPPELTGLAVVPATAQVVVGADLAKLTDSPVVDRQLDQLLARDQVLAQRWKEFADHCKVNVGKQIKRVMLALGPHAGPQPGTGPVLMVAVGSLPEADLKECVTRLVGSGGGTLTGKAVLGRTLYLVKDGNRTMYFAYSRPDTVVLSADEAFITEALGAGKKATDNTDLAAWRKLVDENSPLWAVGRVDDRIRDGLVQLTEGKLREGPIAFGLNANLANGLKWQFKAVMRDAEQAKSLESYVKDLMGLLTAAAQLKSLGSVVGKVAVTTEANIVQIAATLTVDDINQVLSALDGGSTPAQDRAPPPAGAGSDPK